MNIVKGVADLIRRTSGGQTVELNSGTQTEKFTAPTPKIRFRQVGDEAILHTLWERYESATDKVEKKSLLHVFLKQFLDVYKNWEPVGGGQMPEVYTSNDTPAEFSSRIDGIVDGCSAGHPAAITLILIEEVTKLTAAITEWTTIDVTTTSDRMPVLNALAIVTRSMHNCRVFGYYGGMQKLTALMKAAVVQLKTTTSAVSAEDSLSDSIVDKIGFLQKLLVYVVSIICSFIDLDSNIYERASLCSNTLELSVPGGVYSPIDNSSLNAAKGEAKLHWHQKAIVSVMEAGGLNWLVELLRVIRRLSVKEHWTDASLQYLSLRTLHSALSENPRGQNHFRSIGGLEVLLDGLVPANSVSLLKKSFSDDRERCIMPVLSIFQLHVLSLEVLREAVFGSLNNLQFLCENGRIHKFANSFCSPAFMLQEYNLQDKDIPFQEKTEVPVFQCRNENHVHDHVTEHSDSLTANASYLQCWIEYVVNLSRVLCSFILFPGDINSSCIQVSSIRNTMPISSFYTELSIKWAMRVLHTVFPCIKACSYQSELPSQLRIFVNTLQHYVLNAFKKVLVLSPLLLEVFRHEGMWDLIFSENFFYFGPASDKAFEESCTFEGFLKVYDNTPVCTDSQVKVSGVEILQMEAISFVEFAATVNDSAHNLPECSVLLDTLEQSACNPEIARVLAKTLICILRISAEKTVVSFKSLNAIPRVLKVACIQAQELRRSSNTFGQASSGDIVPAQGSSSSESSHSWMESMETSMDLFIDYLALADDAKGLIMHSTTCVDCLFDLFWEERLRNRVLTHVLDLMKIVPFSEDDHKSKLYLCSKYLELFTQIKEQEKCFAELSIDLLVGMRDMLLIDQEYFQGLFRDGECFLHVVSLLNGNLDESNGEKLVLNVLQTLISLLANNDISKAAFRALVGKGYQTLQSLLLDFCQWQPSEDLLNRLLDMLVDGKFDIKESPMIKNEDVIILYLSVLQKSSDLLRNYGLNVFQQLIRDSISNRASCVRAGMLNFLLDWYSEEDKDSAILKITQLIQVIGGHSISGKDIRKIFALLRSDKAGRRQHYSSLLMTSVLSMLNEKGPTAFFDLNGNNSGVKIKTLQWPLNKGFSFSCWLRVESFPRNGMLGLFSFLTENGKGCYALLAKDKLVYESINQKRQCVALKVNIIRKKWHFLCLTHSIGRAFSGGSLLKCYVDGEFVSSERCRYAKINEPMTNCGIGRKLNLPSSQEDNSLYSIKDSCSFLGQIGPIYMFNDAITSDLVKGMYSLGPSYMYSFLDNEVALFCDNPLPSGILDAKDGLASRIIFGLNAQASDGRTLFNVAPISDSVIDSKAFEASVLFGTQLCSRRLLQQIIYCVGGVSVFFPLLTQSNRYEIEKDREIEHSFFPPITRERPTAEVIELIASVLDENIANQQQMHLLSGFLILGFLLQSVPPQHLNLETLSALKHIFNVIGNGGLSEVLVKSAISSIFLNPLIWVYTAYKVQRELYLFLIQQFDNDPRLYKSLCRLPHVMDIIRQFYWDTATSRSAIGSKPLLHPISKKVIGERPNKEEIHKIRLVLLSLGEMSLRQNIEVSDIKSLIAFFETSHDMACIEDVLHMVIRAVSQKSILASFLEQVNLVGGCHIFVNLLRRDYEPVRLLSLQFLGRLLVALPSERKGPRFFNLAVVRTRSPLEGQRKISSRMQPIFSAMSDRLFTFPQTDHLCATLFDVLLGGASPKQVLQKHNQPEKQKSKVNSSHFFLPQILVLIFRFLSNCEDRSARLKIIGDLLDLLNSNFSNIESLMEYGWTDWLEAAMKLDVFKSYEVASQNQCDEEKNEQKLIRILFSVVLCHCTRFIKSGWQHLEETVNFLLMHCEQDAKLHHCLLRDIYEDLIRKLVELSSEENIFSSQPCRDNTLYLLRMVDEMLISEMNKKLPFPGCSSDFSLDSLEIESQKDFSSALYEALHGESNSQIRNMQICKNPLPEDDEIAEEKWWTVYDNLWIIIFEINGKGPSKILPKFTSSVGPSLGQRARGLVESLNIPAAEMAAVVVSGGIGNALGGKSNKNIDKAMLLRGEKFPKIIFRLVILYLCRSSLERASRCVQQVISLLPCLLVSEDEQSKSRLQLFIWSLLAVRSQYGMLDEGARFHVISHLIRETVNCGKSVLASSIIGRDEPSETGSNARESTTLHNVIQKDLVLTAVADEAKYIQNSNAERNSQLHELRIKMGENLCTESNQRKAFEDEIQSSLNTVLTSDEKRRAAFQLARDEEQQNVAEKWIHLFRALIDERGPWSSNPFPNCAVSHWKLDKTEDTWRRRPKLRRNYRFDEKLCHPPSTSPSTETVLSTSETKSSFGLHVPEQMKRLLVKGVRRITDESSDNDTDQSESGQEASVPVNSLDNLNSDLIKDSNDPKDIIHEWKEPSSSSQENETSEVLLSVQSVLVTPKRKLAGHLAVLKNVMHFFGECLDEGTGGSTVFRNLTELNGSDMGNFEHGGGQKNKFVRLPSNIYLDSEKGIVADNIDTVYDYLLQRKIKNIKRHRRWEISKIKAVHLTRYLLGYTALEIFFNNSVAPVFFNFASQKDANDVGMLIVATRNESLFPKGSTRDKNYAISFVDRRVAQEMAETARESWRRREMTNFEYLLILNTLAGRSYNDLTQYPVFPWVLADYSSETLDFNKSSTFRDLSKPIGALDSKRLEVFEDRYRNFSDPDIPSFYYGSHYSSMGIVLYYLLRLEPFTSLHRNLQGGKFDHADRLFQSIHGTYQNCLSNTSDVKELIPEFFYMPEFLVNSSSYHLGVKQDGDPIGDVCLPPWAKGSPEEFINQNREALESEYVSSNLHHWIDLIFGYKQRGKPAVEAANIFYYVTYEGAVDLDTMDDELQRSAIEDQIANFGQTPIQIFHKKHPRRGPPIPIAHPLYFAPGSINLTSIISSPIYPALAVLFLGMLESNIVIVNEGLSMSVKMWVTTQLQSGGNFTFSGSQDPFFGIGSDILSPRKIGSPLAENIELGAQCFAIMPTPSENFLISCGSWENSFQVISLNDGRLVQSIRQHKDVVSCVAVTSDGSVLATGSYDTTVMVWEVAKAKTLEKRVRNAQTEVPRKDYVIVETPFHILCGHDDIITCLYVSVELDIVISGSRDGTCVLHTLREGRYVKSLRHPSGSALSKLVVSRHGLILFYSDDDLSLHLYSINGKHIASSESNGRLNCVELSCCGEFLVCAGDQGQITVRSMNSLEIVRKYNGIGKIITSLAVTPEECFLAGTKDGSLLVYSIDNPQLRKATLPRNVKSKAPV